MCLALPELRRPCSRDSAADALYLASPICLPHRTQIARRGQRPNGGYASSLALFSCAFPGNTNCVAAQGNPRDLRTHAGMQIGMLGGLSLVLQSKTSSKRAGEDGIADSEAGCPSRQDL